MRRILFSAFVLIFSSQSSGIGMAVEPGRPGYQDSLFADLHSAINGVVQSPLLAIVLAPDRYAAMHAPPPVRVTVPRSDASNKHLSGVIRPQSNGPGIRVSPPMRSTPLLPKDAAKLTPPATGGTGTSTPSTRLNAALSAPVLARSPVFRVPALPLPTHKPSSKITPFDVTTGTANTAGINPWWT